MKRLPLLVIACIVSMYHTGCATGDPATDARRAEFNRALGRGVIRLISGVPRTITMEESVFGNTSNDVSQSLPKTPLEKNN